MNELDSERARELLRRAFFLTGPTASGKSAVALLIAERINAEIIALDSMTLYRGLDIGTAKPMADERARVPHHLIDVLDPWEAASVALYREWAIQSVEQILERGKLPLFVGGTALYLKAILRGLFRGPESDAALRSALEAEAEALGDSALHAKLAAADPMTAARLHPNDRRRVVRALEVLALTGRPMSAWQTEHGEPASGFRVLALERGRAELQARIDSRIDRMFEEGLIGEVERLRELPKPVHENPMRAVGYAEVNDLLNGVIDREECVARIRLRTRRFAKHQQTWFRGLKEVECLGVTPEESTSQTAARVLEWLESRSARH